MIGGIFLFMFSDAILFDMMLKTAFKDGVDTIENLIDREMRLGIIQSVNEFKSSKLISSYVEWSSSACRIDERLRLRTLPNTRNNNKMFIMFINH